MNYHNKKFRGRSNSENGEVSSQTVFHYFQEGIKLWGTYSGGSIIDGHLLGTVSEDGSLNFLYHHINENGELMAGQCRSIPELSSKGNIILKERWQWLTGDQSNGYSEVEEITEV